MNVRPALLTLAILITATACSAGAGPSPGASPGTSASPDPAGSAPPAPTAPASTSPTAPASTIPTASADPSDEDGASRELILRVDTSGGLVAPDQGALSIPQVSVYADGRVISMGAQIMIYPGPALPPLMLSRLSPAGLERILAAAAEAGLTGGDRHLTMRGVADAHTTTFTVTADGRTSVVSAEGLGLEAGDDDQLDPTDLQARRAMLDLQGRLGDLPSWLGTDVIADGLPYGFEELRIFTRPDAPPEDPDLAQPALEWPLDVALDAFGEPYPLGEGARCGTVSGEDLQTLLPLVMGANQLTPWVSAGEDHTLLLRPLLPDEQGCPER